MMNFILFFALSLSAFASSREEAITLIEKAQSTTDITQRMDVFTKGFLGLPYGAGGPLGEGPQGRFDQDPLYRFDTFDCTTFVETIVSLALSADVDQFERAMDEIRYEDSQVEYLKRNHYPEIQWIPNNVRNGLLVEINNLILPLNQQKIAVAEINLPGWLKKIQLTEIRVPMASESERLNLLSELRSYSSQYRPVISRLPYLPISTLLAKPKLLKLIPNGAIVNFVRPNWDLTEVAGTHMNISHQGFVFQKSTGTFLRHASSGAEKLVMEVPLYDYLKKFENHATMKGIHLMQVTQAQ